MKEQILAELRRELAKAANRKADHSTLVWAGNSTKREKPRENRAVHASGRARMVQRVKAPSLIDVLPVDFLRSTVDGLKGSARKDFLDKLSRNYHEL